MAVWKVSLGEEPPDLALLAGRLFNPFIGRFEKNRLILVKDGIVAYVGEPFDFPRSENTSFFDFSDKTVVPGLVESHTHLLFRSSIKEYVPFAIKGGVTTVVTEIIELASIVGEDGIRYAVETLKRQPINFFYTFPAMCGLTEEEEVNALGEDALLKYINDPLCLGLGEVYWGNALVPGPQGDRVRRLMEKTRLKGKKLEGHTAGAKGGKLQAYTSFLVTSCHEPITAEEAYERLRLGYWVLIREGAIRRDLQGVKDIFRMGIELRRVVLCTDGSDPRDLLEEGCLDASLRSALSMGIPPELAYSMVTLNPAEHFSLDFIGGIAPGRYGDMVVIPSPEEYRPLYVFCRGRMIFKEGEVLVEPAEDIYPEHMLDTVRIGGFEVSEPPRGKVRVIRQVARLVTKEEIAELDGDSNIVLAIERTGRGGLFQGYMKGLGLKRGACGTTMCWDTCDALIVGKDSLSIKTAARRLEEIKGGAVFAIGDRIVAEYPAPVCGVLSMEPMETLGKRLRKLEDSLKENGVPWERPLLTIDTLTTATIPHLRITHRGYVRLKDRKVLGLL